VSQASLTCAFRIATTADVLAFYARRGYADVGVTTYTFQDEQYENRVFVKTLPSRNR
jgi:hypothetical protein